MKNLWKIITQKSLVTHKSHWQGGSNKKRDILSACFASHKQLDTLRLALALTLTQLALGLTLALAITHYELSWWGLIVFKKTMQRFIGSGEKFAEFWNTLRP